MKIKLTRKKRKPVALDSEKSGWVGAVSKLNIKDKEFSNTADNTAYGDGGGDGDGGWQKDDAAPAWGNTYADDARAGTENKEW